jgi:hypothetical protein
MKFSELPTLGEPLEVGTFCGLTTLKDGTHAAVVLLPARPAREACEWSEYVAAEQGGAA